MKEKQLEALIKKIQKQQEAMAQKKVPKINVDEVSEEQAASDAVFSEMKKRPYSE